MKKQLLCRPCGGLNDMLNQIYLCMSYAKKFDRELWVDTTRSGFGDCFRHYFNTTSEMNFGVPEDHEARSCFPHEVEGKIMTYQRSWHKDFGGVILLPEGPLLTFDFDRDYEEELLIHDQVGGGKQGSGALRVLTLKDNIASEIKEQLIALGSYIAIHVRHTDYKTDYQGFFARIKQKVGDNKVVLCTDSFECQQYAQSVFPNIEMASDIPDTQGKSLHENPEVASFETNVQTLKDLVVISCGREFLYAKTEGKILSGFAILALCLRGKGLRNKLWAWLYGEVSFLQKVKPRPRRGLLDHLANMR